MAAVALVLLAGCAGPGTGRASRLAVTGAGAAAGAAAAGAVSDGDTGAMLAGAAGGAVLSAALLGSDPESARRGFDEGYVRGQSDSIKRHYWMRQALERSPAQPDGKRVFYTVPGPRVTEDGRELAPHGITVPVIE